MRHGVGHKSLTRLSLLLSLLSGEKSAFLHHINEQTWQGEYKARTFATHGDRIGHPYRVVLPTEHSLLLHRILDCLGKIEH